MTFRTDRLTITSDTAAIWAKILQKRASRGRWRPNRKWKYGGDPIFRLSDPNFLFDFLYIMGSISNRYELWRILTLCHVKQRGTWNFHGVRWSFWEKIQDDKPLKNIMSHCCSVSGKKSITASKRLLQPTALLPTGRCHINFPPENPLPLHCGLWSSYFDHLLLLLS